LASILVLSLLVVLGVFAYTRLQGPSAPIAATAAPVEAAQTNRWKPRAPLSQPRGDFGVAAYDG
jgi:hypothetical protein